MYFYSHILFFKYILTIYFSHLLLSAFPLQQTALHQYSAKMHKTMQTTRLDHFSDFENIRLRALILLEKLRTLCLHILKSQQRRILDFAYILESIWTKQNLVQIFFVKECIHFCIHLYFGNIFHIIACLLDYHKILFFLGGNCNCVWSGLKKSEWSIWFKIWY